MKTEFAGLKLDNPVIVAAGPWSNDGRGIKKAFEAGAGAVVTESIVSDPVVDVCPRIVYDGLGAQNIRLYSDIQVEYWEREMDIAKSGGGLVIANVTATAPTEIAYLASKLERFGADAIEMGVSVPFRESLEVAAANAEKIYEMTREVVSTVDIPVIVKLSQNTTNISNVAKAVKKAGAAAVSAINSVRCILGVDVETGQPMLPTYGGYSGPPIRPLGLASVATIAQSTNIPICGIGGIENATNALEYIMLGASAVQIGTAFMLNGPEIITRIVNDLEAWGDAHGVTDVEQIRGKALANLRNFDEIKVEPAVTKADNSKVCADNCDACIRACVYGATSRTGEGVEVDETICSGCGLCNFVCPAGKLTLV